MSLKIHYALQTCDVSVNWCNDRYCKQDKITISKKCTKSFFDAVKYLAEKVPETEHVIAIIDDHSSESYKQHLKNIVERYSSSNIRIEFIELEDKGIMNSIGKCYEWIDTNGEFLVYQVQDDYLFNKESIYEMVDVYLQVSRDLETVPVITPYNAPYLWNQGSYLNVPTPRTIIVGIKRYWIQTYDFSCSFMTHIEQFRQHRDLLALFLATDPVHPKLEAMSINKIFVERGVLGLSPFESISLHMQSDNEKDPYIDWQARWDAVEDL